MTFSHIHIDPVGGIAGDMFVAAMLDLFPESLEDMLENLRCVPALKDIDARVESHSDSILVGRRFNISGPELDHHHAHYRELLSDITGSSMKDEVKNTASQILKNLARAEATVHGIEIDQVTLHEAGSPDSLTDIVCAAFLICTAGVSSWSCASLPAGNGTVKTAHGVLPLPAPAVAELLKGCPVHNDGREGERVTPTGAAILRTINPRFDSRRSSMTLSGTGQGFGSAAFQGISNVLRLTAYQETLDAVRYERVAVLNFEVDDQPLEDLSIGLERLRASPGVLDVIQIPAMGKKSRMTVQVQVLAEPEQIDEVASRCALETATLGVRVQTTDRLALRRDSLIHNETDTAVPLKVAVRPDGGHTAKVDSDHLVNTGGYSQRKSVKQAAELSVEKNLPKG